MRTIVYVDGFNLYYGCLKGSRYRWLDLYALFQKILSPDNEIVKIKYFTARVQPKPSDPDAPKRQQIYIKSLCKMRPCVIVHYGHFLSHKTRMANAKPPPNTVEVIKTEEKGSDVNLSVHLLNDAWLDRYDVAVVVTNDSDMAEAMKLVRRSKPEKIIGLITPSETGRTSRQLSDQSSFQKTIRRSDLVASQLPTGIPDTSLFKPNSW